VESSEVAAEGAGPLPLNPMTPSEPSSPLPNRSNSNSNVNATIIGNNEKVPMTADLDAFAMQCSQDYWEGAYHMERTRRIRTAERPQHIQRSESVDSQVGIRISHSLLCCLLTRSAGRECTVR